MNEAPMPPDEREARAGQDSSVLLEDVFLPRNVGPNGGDLNRAALQPEYRRSSLNAKVSDSGLPLLHRFEREDSATCGRKDEKPWHRMAAFMLLAGRTNSEIAMAADVTAPCVSHIRAQRWFQELLAVLANETGSDITGLLASEAQNSLNVMVEMRDTAKSERTRYQAAKDILELSHGKATQTIVSSVSHTTHASPSEEMESIQQQLAGLRSSAAREAGTTPALPQLEA